MDHDMGHQLGIGLDHDAVHLAHVRIVPTVDGRLNIDLHCLPSAAVGPPPVSTRRPGGPAPFGVSRHTCRLYTTRGGMHPHVAVHGGPLSPAETRHAGTAVGSDG